MNCRRSEELWTDYLEGSLSPPLGRQLEEHLDTCDDCAALYRAFQEVTSALSALKVPEAPGALRDRVLDRLRDSRPTQVSDTPSDIRSMHSPVPPPRTIAAFSWLAAAAMLTFVLLWRPPELMSDVSRRTTRAAHQVYSFGVRTYHQTERWVEDLNVLRMTVGVAFEDRLDRLNEQLRDLEEAGRRSDEDDDEQSRHERFQDRAGAPERAVLASDPTTRSFL